MPIRLIRQFLSLEMIGRTSSSAHIEGDLFAQVCGWRKCLDQLSLVSPLIASKATKKSSK
jgi:hypothetical protein